MIAVISSATLIGTSGHPVSVEVHVARGLPGFTVVGLPDPAVRESRDRVRAALLSSGFSWPNQRVTVNLAPSGVRKGGAGFDLPIAVGLLVATAQLPACAVRGIEFAGELGLCGALRPVAGVMALADALSGQRLVVPDDDAPQAALVRPHAVHGFATLLQLAHTLSGLAPWPETPPTSMMGGRGGSGPAAPTTGADDRVPDLADVRGQAVGRRAVEVAAAGGHHLLLVGPPGSGKTMLAQRLPGVLPPLSLDAALGVARVHSAANVTLPPGGLSRRPPFRAPHHGASAVSLIGGGTGALRPGEISLATGGILFLDELGEFSADVLDSLRQPLEEGLVRVSRSRATVTFPAKFLLVAAMNPCPCGDWSGAGSCRCTEAARTRYSARISAPIFDRFDLVVPLHRPEADELLDPAPAEGSEAVARRVARARRVAELRGVSCNADLAAGELDRWAPLSREATAMLDRHVRTGRVSARGLHRLRRVALTLADLEGLRVRGPAGAGSVVQAEQVAEAAAMRAGRSTLGLVTSR